MTTTPPSASSSSPTEPEAGPHDAAAPPGAAEVPDASGGSGPAIKVLKGCGCLSALIVLAGGVALVGGGEPASWGSALFGVVILLIMVGSSGLIGWWNR